MKLIKKEDEDYAKKPYVLIAKSYYCPRIKLIFASDMPDIFRLAIQVSIMISPQSYLNEIAINGITIQCISGSGNNAFHFGLDDLVVCYWLLDLSTSITFCVLPVPSP